MTRLVFLHKEHDKTEHHDSVYIWGEILSNRNDSPNSKRDESMNVV